MVTSVSLIGIWLTYFFSKKQIHFAAMEKCIDDYRDFIKEEKDDDRKSSQYIDLVNEEFFYMASNYLPIKVSIEWIDGMIDYLPFYDKQGKFIAGKKLKSFGKEHVVKKLLNDYPRVLKAIKIKAPIDFNKIHLEVFDEKKVEARRQERNKLIEQIILNLKKSNRLNRYCLKRKIAAK